MNTDEDGVPQLGLVRLPVGPVQAKFFHPAGPAGSLGDFGNLYEFDWRIYLARVPPAALQHLLPRADSRVNATMQH